MESSRPRRQDSRQQTQKHKQSKKHQPQKRLRDGRRWRYVDVDHTPRFRNDDWLNSTPTRKMWNSFFHQTDAARKKVAVEKLVHALLHERSKRRSRLWRATDFKWLEGWIDDGTTAEERLIQLRRWIIQQLKPLLNLSPSSTDSPTATARRDDEQGMDHQSQEGTPDEERVTTKRGNSDRERFRHEWRIQVASLRLASALVVLCEAEHAHLFLDDLHSEQNKRNKPRMLHTLRRLAMPAESTASEQHGCNHERQQWQSDIRQEAMSVLAVAGMVVEDSALVMEICEYLGMHYIQQRSTETMDEVLYDRYWLDGEDIEDVEAENDDGKVVIDDSGDSESSEDDEVKDCEDEPTDDEKDTESDTSEDAGDQPSSDDESCDEDDDSTNNNKGAGRMQHGENDGDTAVALEVIVFLIALLDDKESWIRTFIGRHRDALVSMIFVKEGHDIAGTAKLRMQAAQLLSILFRLSPSTMDHDESTEGDNEDEGEEDNDECMMASEGKRRFLALLRTFSCSSGEAKRTRGHLRRRWEQKQSMFFRKMRTELLAHESQRRGCEFAHGRSEIDDEVEVRRIGRKEYHAGRLNPRFDMFPNAPKYFKVEGWQWMARRGFLRKYFNGYFDGLVKRRTQFRFASKLLPVSREDNTLLESCDFDIKLHKVDKSKLEGMKKQTKRYRRSVNGIPIVSDYYSSRWADIEDQARARTGRTIEKEWRKAEKHQGW